VSPKRRDDRLDVLERFAERWRNHTHKFSVCVLLSFFFFYAFFFFFFLSIF
jgi:hypothetical protein